MNWHLSAVCFGEHTLMSVEHTHTHMQTHTQESRSCFQWNPRESCSGQPSVRGRCYQLARPQNPTTQTQHNLSTSVAFQTAFKFTRLVCMKTPLQASMEPETSCGPVSPKGNKGKNKASFSSPDEDRYVGKKSKSHLSRRSMRLWSNLIAALPLS